MTRRHWGWAALWALVLMAAPLPAWAKDTRWLSTPGAETYPDAPYLIVRRDVAYTNSGSAWQRDEHQAVKILSAQGAEAFEILRFYYTPRTQGLDILDVRLISPAGDTAPVALNQVSEGVPLDLQSYPAYTGLHYKELSLPPLSDNWVLEYRVRVTQRVPVAGPALWGAMAFEDVVPVLGASFSANVPAGLTLHSITPQARPLMNVQFANPASPGGIIYQWSGGVSSAVPVEPAMPALADVVSQVQVSTIPAWDEVGAWFAGIASPRAAPDGKITALARRLTAGRPGTRAKLRALYDYVSAKIFAVDLDWGTLPLEQYSAAGCLTQGYGDTMDRGLLLWALCRAAGIAAHPALLSTAAHGQVHEDLPSPGQFNRMILVADMGSQRVWMDTMERTTTFGDLPPQDQGRRALVVGDRHSAFATTPVTPAAGNMEWITATGILHGNGKLEGSLLWQEEGVNGAYWRQSLELLNGQEQALFLKGRTTVVAPTAALTALVLSNLTDLDRPLRFGTAYMANPYAVKVADEYMVARMPVAPPPRLTALVRQDPKTRIYPLVLGHTYGQVRKATLSVPSGMQVVSVPAEVHLNGPVGSYNTQWKVRGRMITFQATFSLPVPVIEIAQYPAFKALLDGIRRHEDEAVVLRPSSP